MATLKRLEPIGQLSLMASCLAARVFPVVWTYHYSCPPQWPSIVGANEKPCFCSVASLALSKNVLVVCSKEFTEMTLQL